MPSDRYIHEEITDGKNTTIKHADAFYALMKLADKIDSTMIASSKGSAENDVSTGIESGHAYAVIQLYEP